eukprot:1154291-Pelagomonas_calceolata.AAC.14
MRAGATGAVDKGLPGVGGLVGWRGPPAILSGAHVFGPACWCCTVILTFNHKTHVLIIKDYHKSSAKPIGLHS